MSRADLPVECIVVACIVSRDYLLAKCIVIGYIVIGCIGSKVYLHVECTVSRVYYTESGKPLACLLVEFVESMVCSLAWLAELVVYSLVMFALLTV